MDGEAGVTTRQVKLKVLYTFDIDHKNNHLARWPQTLDVQAAQLDEINTIGCIDLRTCLQAVITASPELTSNVDNDYTVYAYDYSEPDTPLVGQGMLSKTLSRDASIEMDNEAMITGRIIKSVMGLFSKNAQETLEVKLRLTPVAAQGFRRRSGSVSSNPDTVQAQWNSLSQTNGAFQSASPMDTSGLEAMQRMLSEGGPPRDRTMSFQAETGHSQCQQTSRPTSRAGTPSQTIPLSAPIRQSGSQSRPASRTGVRPTAHTRRESINSGYYSGDDVAEEGPLRKRARVQKVSNPSKSNLNIERQPDSLRVAASTASSVRLHRPVPINPMAAVLQASGQGDELVRPPTPIPGPNRTGRPRGRPRKVVSANLLRGPKPQASSPANLNLSQPIESTLSSPELVRGDSVTSTPADLPSSPPVMQETQNFTTSPQLPPLANDTDSGFMSGCLDDFFIDDGQVLDFTQFLHEKPVTLPGTNVYEYNVENVINVDVEDKDLLANLPPVFEVTNEIVNLPSAMEPPPAPPPAPPPLKKAPSAPNLAKASSFTSHHRPIVPAPRLAPALAPKSIQTDEPKAHQSLPQIPASDPVGRSLHRSNTWAPEMSDAAISDAVTSDEQGKLKPKKRIGKEQTKARLENAIASGEMPPFCDNCGAIETPAWRRAYTKVFDCAWDDLETSLEPGECCYKEPIEHDEEGKIVKFKGYKSEARPADKTSSADGWTQICLCNPCGLWFHKSKFPRPPEKWQKRDPNERRRRRRGPKPRKRSGAIKPTFTSDVLTPVSDDSSPGDTAAEGGDMDENGDGMTVIDDDVNDDNEPELPSMPSRARGASVEPPQRISMLGSEHRTRNDIRQVQSSPANNGSTRASAIRIDMTPKSTVRILFPSPQSLKNKSTAMAAALSASEPQLPAIVRRSPRLNKVRDVFSVLPESSIVVAAGMTEKENVEPAVLHNDGLDDLFDRDFDDSMPPPTTPKRRSERLLFKTPSKTPSREFGETMSPNIQRTPSHSRPSKVSHSITSKRIAELQCDGDLAEMTPFSRLIHETLHGDDTLEKEPPSTPLSGKSRKSRQTPGKNIGRLSEDVFDFPDLPSLKGTSPMGIDLMQAFNFSEMTTEQLHPDFNDVFHTDAPMPSSPPQGYFDFISGKHDHINDTVWPEMSL